ncbi:hypothetical protein SAMN05443377_102116 [Propionibacterium cyclohexanicum]|uniref:DUF2567 domain-containing protein n=1 Tax=Propionibacterium cyclohexanicum TaxID=64702 RepID=A0A1H9Q3V6_9ACTN|nr:hypothetical protein [Propionibacterium cyclohexanicum]SER55147.1 hypothetical protein SAMN05443377_102116 [Propionibacterium cyclohexanicum]
MSTSFDAPARPRAEPVAVHGASAAEPRLTRKRLAARLAMLGITVVVVGVLAAVAWRLTAPAPTITVSGDGTAAVTNRTMAEFFGSDADFMIIGMFAGLGLGALSWHSLKSTGWPVVFAALVAGMLGALVAWRCGLLIGPHDFDERLAMASSGDQVVIDLTLRTPTAWLSWPLGAVLPVLLYSAFGDDRPLLRRPRAVSAGGARRPDSSQESSAAAHRSIRFPSVIGKAGEELSPTAQRSSRGSRPKDRAGRSRH